jgi:lipoprotein-anchoring transpeptidase ErfK/SrfK
VFEQTMSLLRHRRPAAALGAVLSLCALALPAAATAETAAPAAPAASGAPSGTTTTTPPAPATPKIRKLSDERSLSRWAHPARLSDVYTRPSSRGRKIARLRFFNEDGFPEVYMLLRERTDDQEREWVQIRVPKRPNGKTGWVPRDALGPYNVNRQLLIINRTTLRATLYERKRKVWSARVGVGKSATPTPRGHFWVRSKFRFKNSPVYGTRAIGTSAYAPTLTDWPNGGVVGIHGTNQPELIPGRPSHGCIRVKNADIARLWRKIKLGTPIWVRG